MILSRRCFARSLPLPPRCATERPLARRVALAAALLLFGTAAAAVAAPTSPPPASRPPAAAPAELADIQAYLNSIHTLKAHFLQVAPDGALSEGTTWLERPGRMRFQYAPPTPLLLVAGDGLVMFHDASLGQTSTVPLGSTPLGILLAPEIRLDGPVVVTALRHLPGEVAVSLHRRAAPGQGSLTLVFSTDPLSLRQWTVIDAQQQRTTVTLENVETGGHFPASLFNVARPTDGAGVGGGG
jgi:outer membrane lipoprotein-sorting protein